jgi:hypothetical protein
MADEDFYQNLMQYMNQNTTTPFMYSNPLSFSPHEAEKHSLDDAEDFAEDANDSKRRGIVPPAYMLLLCRISQLGNGLWLRRDRIETKEKARAEDDDDGAGECTLVRAPTADR